MQKVPSTVAINFVFAIFIVNSIAAVVVIAMLIRSFIVVDFTNIAVDFSNIAIDFVTLAGSLLTGFELRPQDLDFRFFFLSVHQDSTNRLISRTI